MGNDVVLPCLGVSKNCRFLVQGDGHPFFWLGDTAWELFHRTTREDARLYLSARAEQGFTVIQAVALSEFDGLTVPNAYGRTPLRVANGCYDTALPDDSPEPGGYSYWDHVDYVVKTAQLLGLYIALLPTWGDKYNLAWGKGPEIFDGTSAEAYGRWLGERYKDQSNIVWVLGGDRRLEKRRHFEVIQGMAEGLQKGDGGRHLITFHPSGQQSSSKHVHEESWLDFNMIQSSHGHAERDNYRNVAEDYGKTPIKPTLDAEPCYEDHPRGMRESNGYFDEVDVRKSAYYAVFAGACGHTYGHHSVWSMTTERNSYHIMHWKDALHRPGALQMHHLKALMESRPFLDRVPDQSLIAVNYEGSNYMTATRGQSYAMIYCPNGLAVKVAMGKIDGGEVEASWYDPRLGSFQSAGLFPNEGQNTFLPPTAGRGNDWVLTLDSR